ncbi:hypothetical protein ACM66B_004643 [Microbotryomycetes sp. NB124-2]
MSKRHDMLLQPVHVLPRAPRTDDSRPPERFAPSSSVYHGHVMRMYDVLMLLLSQPPSQRNSMQSLRAWRCLAQCKEIDLRALYLVGASILERSRLHEDASTNEADSDDDDDDHEARQERSRRAHLARAEWLKFTHAGKWQQTDKLAEWIMSLAAGGKIETAIDELETFLPAHPYHDSIKLNTLAAHLVLLHAQALTDNAVRARKEDTDVEDNVDMLDSNDHVRSVKGTDPTKGDTDASHISVTHRFVTRLTKSQPALVARAREYFRQARRLEHEAGEQGTGEAARWVVVMDAVSAALEERKRAESED